MEGDKRTRPASAISSAPPCSALGVAGPGADDAILAAVAVALAQGTVLRLAEPAGDRVAVRPAGIAHVDGNRPAGPLHRHKLAAAAATFAERGPARGRVLGEIVGQAISAALPDRERASGLQRTDAADPQAHDEANAGHSRP